MGEDPDWLAGSGSQCLRVHLLPRHFGPILAGGAIAVRAQQKDQQNALSNGPVSTSWKGIFYATYIGWCQQMGWDGMSPYDPGLLL